ncbi:hypothetical protein [Colwellia sp. MEBiC06753]
MSAKYLNTITISIMLHLALLIALSFQKVNIKSQTETKTKVVNSYLYQPPTNDRVKSSIKEEKLDVADSATKNTPTPAPAQIVTTDSHNTGPRLVHNDIVVEPLTENTTDKPLEREVASSTTFDNLPAQPISTQERQAPVTIDANKSLSQLRANIASQNQVIAAETFNQNRISQQQQIPVSKSQFNEEKIVKKINVVCTSAVNKGIATVSGLLGGTIECEDQPPVNEFIKQRLERMKPATSVTDETN